MTNASRKRAQKQNQLSLHEAHVTSEAARICWCFVSEICVLISHFSSKIHFYRFGLTVSVISSKGKRT